MTDRPLILAAMMTLAFAISGYRFWLVLRPLFHAPGADRLDDIGERMKGVLTNVGLHRRLLNIRYSGVLHALIFSAFIVLFTAIIRAFGSGLFPGFSLAAIGGNTWIAGLQEVFTILILVGLGMALWQRLVMRPARFQGSN